MKNPDLLQRAIDLHRANSLPEAEALYGQILAADPGHFTALSLVGTLATQTRNLPLALQYFDRAIRVDPNAAEPHYNRGVVLAQLGRPKLALESYDRALSINAQYAEAHFNRGNLLRRLQHLEAASASYAAATTHKPSFVEAHSNHGNVLRELKQHPAALACFDRALALRPDYADAHYNRGHVLRDLHRYEEAHKCYERALALNPELPFAFGNRLRMRMQICDWRDFDDDIARLHTMLQAGKAVIDPFSLLALPGSAALQRIAAATWVRERYPMRPMPFDAPGHRRHDKIRLGYFSADFRNHAVSILMAELFRLHDRARFEIIAFSFGPDTQDEMRKRLEQSFDGFIDARNLADAEVVKLARRLEVDIAVDLGGFTEDSRPTVFALRVAPLQVSYIGFLGTLGAEFMDYLIADATLIRDEDRCHYAEKIINLPSYQVNDTRRSAGDRRVTRAELGLPAEGTVFCCFNANYKITPMVFSAWMRILGRVPGSVLLLYRDNEAAARNLRNTAAALGVDPRRLVFGGKLGYADHLARLRVADLFLDTLPYNAGTTASDALWVGLPVLTCSGGTFASRMGSSILHSVGLPELVTETLPQYEECAVELAADSARLGAIRAKRAANRLKTPLFDTPRFLRHLESAFKAIYDRQLAGLAPEPITIAESDRSNRACV